MRTFRKSSYSNFFLDVFQLFLPHLFFPSITVADDRPSWATHIFSFFKKLRGRRFFHTQNYKLELNLIFPLCEKSKEVFLGKKELLTPTDPQGNVLKKISIYFQKHRVILFVFLTPQPFQKCQRDTKKAKNAKKAAFKRKTLSTQSFRRIEMKIKKIRSKKIIIKRGRKAVFRTTVVEKTYWTCRQFCLTPKIKFFHDFTPMTILFFNFQQKKALTTKGLKFFHAREWIKFSFQVFSFKLPKPHSFQNTAFQPFLFLNI